MLFLADAENGMSRFRLGKNGFYIGKAYRVWSVEPM
jgi:hypothetical protein